MSIVLAGAVLGFQTTSNGSERFQTEGIMRPSRFDEASTQEIIAALEASIGPDKQVLLRKIDYRTFLFSTYWEAIRVLVFRRSPKCACGERASVVHHLTYEHRGQEWRHLDDLEAVCRPCHEVESIQAIADRGGDGITTIKESLLLYTGVEAYSERKGKG